MPNINMLNQQVSIFEDASAYPKVSTNRSKFITALITFGIFIVLLISASALGFDDFVTFSIPLKGDRNWYLDVAEQMQDREIYYHGIGKSISSARGSDIIILGSSFTTFGVNPALIRQFEKAHGLKVHNMSFMGIVSGEFSRRVIERWRIRPLIWLINADDFIESFFSRSASCYRNDTQPRKIGTLQQTRLLGYLRVTQRNLQLRAADRLSGERAFPGFFRNAVTGDINCASFPAYVANDHKAVSDFNEDDRGTTRDTINVARQYLGDIGGKAVLILVPHMHCSSQQAKELADALGVELILFNRPQVGLTFFDPGYHLDQNGSQIYTRFLLEKLALTKTFAEAIEQKRQNKRELCGRP